MQYVTNTPRLINERDLRHGLTARCSKTNTRGQNLSTRREKTSSHSPASLFSFAPPRLKPRVNSAVRICTSCSFASSAAGSNVMLHNGSMQRTKDVVGVYRDAACKANRYEGA